MKRKEKHPLLISLGNKIKELRKKENLSQEALAHKADLDRTYVGGIERGERNVALINLNKISNALNISLAQLLEGIE